MNSKKCFDDVSNQWDTIRQNSTLATKAASEVEWLNRIDEHADGKFALIAWSAEEIKGDRLLAL